MNLPETGVLDLNWTIDSSFSGYKVEIYRDEEQVSQSFIEPNTINSLSFTGFAEGNSGRAEVFGYQKFRGHKIYSPTGLYSNSTFFFPENFNTTSGNSFYFTGIEVNNTSLDSTLYTGNIYEADASYELPDSPNDGIDFNFSDPKPRIIGLTTTSKVNSGQLYEVDRVRFTSSTGTIASIRINGTDNLNIAYRGVSWEMTSIAQSGGLFSTGSINDDTVNIKYDLISPRSGNLIDNFQEFIDEPFAQKITGYFSDSQGYQFLLNDISSNSINHNYTGNDTSFYLNLFSLDFYSGLSTGVLKINNEKTSVIDLQSTKEIISGSGKLSLFPSFSRATTGNHVFLYEDSSLSTLSDSIFSTGTEFSFSIPLNTSRYVKIIPYTRFESGNHFYDSGDYGIYSIDTEVESVYKITNQNFLLFSGNQYAKINCYSNLESYSGYHLDLSIYSGENVASNQYFSGSFNEDIVYDFDITGSRSGKENEFNVDCLLYKSGNLKPLDSGSLVISSLYPQIIKATGIEFQDINRQDFDFSWDCNLQNFEDYLTFLISYDGVTQYKTGDNSLSLSIPSSRQRSIEVSLASNSNTGNIFDTVYLTGISYAPVIDHLKNENNLYYTPKYDQVVLSPTISTSKRNISGFKLYQKKSFSFEPSETGSDQLLSGLKESVESYPLNSSYLYQSVSLGEKVINVPAPEDTVVATTGNLYTGTIGTGFQSGYYTSGNIYNYKLVPFDFVGSGEVLSFDLEQSVSNVTKVIRQDTDTTIVNITNVTSEVSNVGTDLSGVSGDVNTVSSNLSTVSGDVNTVSSNLSTVSGNLDSVNIDLSLVSGKTNFLPTGQQILSGNLNVTGDSHISGELNVGRSDDNVLFAVDGTGSFINSNLEISGRLAVSGRITLGGDPPTSSTNTGVFGQIAFDDQYFYVCTGTNKWGRVELSSW